MPIGVRLTTFLQFASKPTEKGRRGFVRQRKNGKGQFTWNHFHADAWRLAETTHRPAGLLSIYNRYQGKQYRDLYKKLGLKAVQWIGQTGDLVNNHLTKSVTISGLEIHSENHFHVARYDGEYIGIYWPYSEKLKKDIAQIGCAILNIAFPNSVLEGVRLCVVDAFGQTYPLHHTHVPLFAPPMSKIEELALEYERFSSE